jgi:hypothetical protein
MTFCSLLLKSSGGRIFGQKISATYNVCGHLYNGTIKKGKQMLFEDVISEDAINALTPSQIAEIEAILEKAGY